MKANGGACKNKTGKWVFYQGVDSAGNDVGQFRRRSVDAWKELCHELGAVAFNTNGWLKSKIEPKAKWSIFSSRARDGLYVWQQNEDVTVKVEHQPLMTFNVEPITPAETEPPTATMEIEPPTAAKEIKPPTSFKIEPLIATIVPPTSLKIEPPTTLRIEPPIALKIKLPTARPIDPRRRKKNYRCGPRKSSPVWEHFQDMRDHVICLQCAKTIKRKHGGIWGMKYHLYSRHGQKHLIKNVNKHRKKNKNKKTKDKKSKKKKKKKKKVKEGKNDEKDDGCADDDLFTLDCSDDWGDDDCDYALKSENIMPRHDRKRLEICQDRNTNRVNQPVIWDLSVGIQISPPNECEPASATENGKISHGYEIIRSDDVIPPLTDVTEAQNRVDGTEVHNHIACVPPPLPISFDYTHHEIREPTPLLEHAKPPKSIIPKSVPKSNLDMLKTTISLNADASVPPKTVKLESSLPRSPSRYKAPSRSAIPLLTSEEQKSRDDLLDAKRPMKKTVSNRVILAYFAKRYKDGIHNSVTNVRRKLSIGTERGTRLLSEFKTRPEYYKEKCLTDDQQLPVWIQKIVEQRTKEVERRKRWREYEAQKEEELNKNNHMKRGPDNENGMGKSEDTIITGNAVSPNNISIKEERTDIHSKTRTSKTLSSGSSSSSTSKSPKTAMRSTKSKKSHSSSPPSLLKPSTKTTKSKTSSSARLKKKPNTHLPYPKKRKLNEKVASSTKRRKRRV